MLSLAGFEKRFRPHPGANSIARLRSLAPPRKDRMHPQPLLSSEACASLTKKGEMNSWDKRESIDSSSIPCYSGLMLQSSYPLASARSNKSLYPLSAHLETQV